MSYSCKNEGVAWWEEEVVVVVMLVVVVVVVLEFRLPARQLSPFSRRLVSFYRVWSIELGSHFAQVCVCFFLSIIVVKLNIAAHCCRLNASRQGRGSSVTSQFVLLGLVSLYATRMEKVTNIYSVIERILF